MNTLDFSYFPLNFPLFSQRLDLSWPPVEGDFRPHAGPHLASVLDHHDYIFVCIYIYMTYILMIYEYLYISYIYMIYICWSTAYQRCEETSFV